MHPPGVRVLEWGRESVTSPLTFGCQAPEAVGKALRGERWKESCGRTSWED